MKTKKLLLCSLVTLLLMGLASSSSLAGSKQRHRWEGVAIGVGAAILGHAIYQAHQTVPRPQVVYGDPETRERRHHVHCHGHLEWQKVWVPSVTERVWNPGHYNRGGRWVKGHWIEVVRQEGYWSRERVWLADNQCRR